MFHCIGRWTTKWGNCSVVQVDQVCGDGKLVPVLLPKVGVGAHVRFVTHLLEYTLKVQMHSGCHSGSNRHIVESADGSSRSSRMKRLISAHFGLMAALMLVMAPVQSFAAKEESTTATEKANSTE